MPTALQWLKIDPIQCLQNIVFHFWPKLTHPARGLSAIAELLVVILHKAAIQRFSVFRLHNMSGQFNHAASWQSSLGALKNFDIADAATPLATWYARSLENAAQFATVKQTSKRRRVIKNNIHLHKSYDH